jgi:hypothetical protein
MPVRDVVPAAVLAAETSWAVDVDRGRADGRTKADIVSGTVLDHRGAVRLTQADPIHRPRIPSWKTPTCSAHPPSVP